MSGARKQARRYHRLSEGLASFVDAPHFAIDGEPGSAPILNMTDERATPAREAQLSLLREGARGDRARGGEPLLRSGAIFPRARRQGRHPYPVPLKVYDRTITVLRAAVDRAKLGNDDKLAALRQLDAEARRLECFVTDVDFEGFVAEEQRLSPERGGRTVMDDARERAEARRTVTPRARRSRSRAQPDAPPEQLSLRLPRR